MTTPAFSDTPTEYTGVDAVRDDQDYAEYQAWKRSSGRDAPDSPTVPTTTPVPTTAPTTGGSSPEGRGWSGGELAKPAPKPEPDVEQTPQSYIWLADGSVERVEDSDLPGVAGVGSQHGHWERDGKVYSIVGVYPVEIELKRD